MNITELDYYLPKELIAQYPLQERDAARLLVLDRKTGMIEHRVFSDISGYFSAGDLLVLNDTKVLSCRFSGRRSSGGRVEVLLLRKIGSSGDTLVFNALLKPGRIRLNEQVTLGNNGRAFQCRVTGKDEVTFSGMDERTVYSLGQVPLPPYIKREPDETDRRYYQTVYASRDGSVASPTAGLHFTEALLERIRENGVGTAYVTLHVGHATFKPIKCDDITGHTMGEETFFIDDRAIACIESARRNKGKICAVGTTSCRTLETFARGRKEGRTGLFIYPGFVFAATNCLLTNFHLPRTTLFALVCAFAGVDLAHKAYQEAVERKYRFYSYGDAMLVL
ncbi:MAG: tRNA preQ1(34) S-adenosylmethionine ribosyltransferase-isomerase QueA [Candidatus Omnitrophica bacterium]|nr:tRNA preQ1(34) S-adenosylmethionine ribosyltransferase-isomerase QueA [Candidatus Omnitrophota bacterium]